MFSRRTASLLVLTLITVAPRLSAAMDADTARMEAANLCTAMPYTCGAVMPPVAAPVERKAPKPPRIHQKPVVVPQETSLQTLQTSMQAFSATLPAYGTLTPLETAGLLACAKVVMDRAILKGATVWTNDHTFEAARCFLLIHGSLR